MQSQPILQQSTEVLGEGSKAVIDSADQYEVFNNAHASDPSHSMLSKVIRLAASPIQCTTFIYVSQDHFGLILNEPAGKIAQVLIQYTTKLIVEAWFDYNSNPDRVIDKVCTSLRAMSMIAVNG